jgi:hypothetical protein
MQLVDSQPAVETKDAPAVLRYGMPGPHNNITCLGKASNTPEYESGQGRVFAHSAFAFLVAIFAVVGKGVIAALAIHAKPCKSVAAVERTLIRPSPFDKDGNAPHGGSLQA